MSPGSAPLPWQRRAGFLARNLDLGRHSAHGIFEGQFEIVAQVVAAAAARVAPARSATAEQVAEAEEVAQNVAEIGERIRVEAGRSRAGGHPRARKRSYAARFCGSLSTP